MTHVHLVSQRDLTEKPSNFDIACRLLKDVLRVEPYANYLWIDGRWQHATIDDIMKRANTRRKSIGQPQFSGKKEWLV